MGEDEKYTDKRKDRAWNAYMLVMALLITVMVFFAVIEMTNMVYALIPVLLIMSIGGSMYLKRKYG